MTTLTDTRRSYLEQFATWRDVRLRDDPSWLEVIRSSAIERFSRTDLPTTKTEEWRFTDLSSLIERRFAPALPTSVDPETVRQALYATVDAPRLVFVNGHYAPELSSPASPDDGVRIEPLSHAMRAGAGTARQHLARSLHDARDPFAALNTAFFEDGAVVTAVEGHVARRPVHVLFLATPDDHEQMIHPRLAVEAEPHSQLSIVEGYYGIGEGSFYFTNAVTELVADEHAVIEHYRLQQETPEALHIGTLNIRQGRASNVSSHSVALGGGLVRNNLNAFLAGEGAECTLNGLLVGTGSRHVDNHLRVEHESPHCRSRQYYKGILNDRSRGVFGARIHVHPGAQKTDAKQTNKNLLLSDATQVNAQPQLEIFADDVKCTHGATVGQLDSDAMFYLRSRGISEAAARKLLILAFAGESIEQIRIPSVREELDRIVLKSFAGDPPELTEPGRNGT